MSIESAKRRGELRRKRNVKINLQYKLANGEVIDVIDKIPVTPGRIAICRPRFFDNGGNEAELLTPLPIWVKGDDT